MKKCHYLPDSINLTSSYIFGCIWKSNLPQKATIFYYESYFFFNVKALCEQHPPCDYKQKYQVRVRVKRQNFPGQIIWGTEWGILIFLSIILEYIYKQPHFFIFILLSALQMVDFMVISDLSKSENGLKWSMNIKFPTKIIGTWGARKRTKTCKDKNFSFPT